MEQSLLGCISTCLLLVRALTNLLMKNNAPIVLSWHTVCSILQSLHIHVLFLLYSRWPVHPAFLLIVSQVCIVCLAVPVVFAIQRSGLPG